MTINNLFNKCQISLFYCVENKDKEHKYIMQYLTNKTFFFLENNIFARRVHCRIFSRVKADLNKALKLRHHQSYKALFVLPFSRKHTNIVKIFMDVNLLTV